MPLNHQFIRYAFNYPYFMLHENVESHAFFLVQFCRDAIPTISLIILEFLNGIVQTSFPIQVVF